MSARGALTLPPTRHVPKEVLRIALQDHKLYDIVRAGSYEELMLAYERQDHDAKADELDRRAYAHAMGVKGVVLV